ncbi:MAG: TraR/DksA C4-type zinc finger protein [Candidatus Pacebacteria bacterium]|nr:TraR/DksA C4-type zinc finger protein [Candidatus Paceibacterota bacterium]MCF7862676.1 TraR/DksA C4-type zinc finger protein [Candidatus Paceibacterota bacterium]
MNKKAQIKQKLEEEKAEILADLSDIGVFNSETNEWEAVPEKIEEPESDQNDMADRFEDSESRVSILEVLQARLSSIEESLIELHKDSFGLCDVCGGEIEEDRLEANPAAHTCKEHLND